MCPPAAPSPTGAQQGSVEGMRRALKDLGTQREVMEAEIAEISQRLNAPGQPGVQGSLLDKEGYPRSDVDVATVRRDRHRLVCLTNDHKALSQQLAGMLGEYHTAARAQAGAGVAAPAAVAPPAGTGAAPGPASTSAAAATTAAAVPASVVPNATAAAPSAGSTAAAVPMDVDGAAAAPSSSGGGGAGGPTLAPFALVDEVTAGSPAAAAGLQVGDLLCSFGEVSASGAGGCGGSSGTGVLQRVAAVLAASEGRPVAATLLRQGAPLAVELTPQRWAGRGLLGCHLQPL